MKKMDKEDKKKLGKATKQICKGVGVAVTSAIVITFVAGKSRAAASEIGDGFKQAVNIVSNLYHQWQENK